MENDLNEKIGKLGIGRLSELEVQSMILGSKSGPHNLKVGEREIPSFLSVYKTAEGNLDVKVHPQRPEIRNDYQLSGRQIQQLEKGEPAVHKDRLFQKDPLTGELRNIELARIVIPEKLENSPLTPQQKQDLLQGKRISIQGRSLRVNLSEEKGYKATTEQKESIKMERSVAR